MSFSKLFAAVRAAKSKEREDFSLITAVLLKREVLERNNTNLLVQYTSSTPEEVFAKFQNDREKDIVDTIRSLREKETKDPGDSVTLEYLTTLPRDKTTLEALFKKEAETNPAFQNLPRLEKLIYLILTNEAVGNAFEYPQSLRLPPGMMFLPQQLVLVFQDNSNLAECIKNLPNLYSIDNVLHWLLSVGAKNAVQKIWELHYTDDEKKSKQIDWYFNIILSKIHTDEILSAITFLQGFKFCKPQLFNQILQCKKAGLLAEATGAAARGNSDVLNYLTQEFNMIKRNAILNFFKKTEWSSLVNPSTQTALRMSFSNLELGSCNFNSTEKSSLRQNIQQYPTLLGYILIQTGCISVEKDGTNPRWNDQATKNFDRDFLNELLNTLGFEAIPDSVKPCPSSSPRPGR